MPNLFLGLTGSVASVKIFHLLREARKRGFDVCWSATQSAEPFILKAIQRKLYRGLAACQGEPLTMRSLFRPACASVDHFMDRLVSGESRLRDFIADGLGPFEHNGWPGSKYHDFESVGELVGLQRSYISGVDREGIVSDEKGRVLHINTAAWADAALIAPASANTLAALVHGITNNFVLDVARAMPRGRPVIVAPAMNTEMWFDPGVQRNVNLISRSEFNGKYALIYPVKKELQCGTVGVGAMEESDKIMEIVASAL